MTAKDKLPAGHWRKVRFSEPARRLDKALAGQLAEEGITRSQITQWFDRGYVGRGDVVLKPSQAVEAGDEVEVFIPAPPSEIPGAERIQLDIRYEDEWLLVVNKPQGMVVHPGAGHQEGTLVNALLYRYGEALRESGEAQRPGIVHRIDKDTSGLLLVVKNPRVHRQMADQIRRHEVVRLYDCLCYGQLAEERATIIAPLGRDPRNRQRQAVREDGREAITHVRVVRRYQDASWLRCKLETGRTHQIRVHLSYIGHPVIADPVYAPNRRTYGLAGQALHASELRFIHPVTGEQIIVRAALPSHFRTALRELGESGSIEDIDERNRQEDP